MATRPTSSGPAPGKLERAFEAEDINPEIVRAVEDAQSNHDPRPAKAAKWPWALAGIVAAAAAWYGIG